ncbi:Netrin receptor UNC5C [Halotydeus destructor]|nr:Netrin receptor UNC5C [Halotydeus destructor]
MLLSHLYSKTVIFVFYCQWTFMCSVATPPQFSEEPDDATLSRTKGATLTCKTQYALNAWFECSSGDAKSVQSKQTGHNYVDPASGIRIIELQLEVTRKDIEEYMSKVLSRSSPSSSLLLASSSSSSSLSSSSPSFLDEASGLELPAYQCWCHAYGQHQTVQSKKATVNFSLQGEWSPWSAWSECSTKCGSGFRKRTRSCSNSLGPGFGCKGDAEQLSECKVHCVPVNGQWTSWSTWSTCSHECQQARRRSCTNPSPKYGGHHCLGSDIHIRNCTGGMCRKLDRYHQEREKEERDSASSAGSTGQEIYILSLITTTFLFLFVVFILILIQRRRYNKNTSGLDMDDESCTGDGHSVLLLMQQNGGPGNNQPDIIRADREKMQLISRITNFQANVLDHVVVRNDRLLSNTNSIDSGISHTNNNQRSPAASSGNGGHQQQVRQVPKATSSLAATTSNSEEEEENDADSEPDYAEPIFNSPSPSLIRSYTSPERKPPLPSSAPPSTKLPPRKQSLEQSRTEYAGGGRPAAMYLARETHFN